MRYPLVYKKEMDMPFALGKIREKSFYKFVTNKKNYVFLFFINTIKGFSLQGYYTCVSKKRFDDVLEKACDMTDVFIAETKGSRRDITIYEDDTFDYVSKEEYTFIYISVTNIEGEFHLCQTYLSEPSLLHEPVLPIKKKR